MVGEMASRKGFRISALLGPTGTRSLQNFAHFPREKWTRDVDPGHDVYVLLVSGSHFGVCFA